MNWILVSRVLSFNPNESLFIGFPTRRRARILIIQQGRGPVRTPLREAERAPSTVPEGDVQLVPTNQTERKYEFV